MENPKRHKRSGSSSAPKGAYSQSYAKKKYYLPKIHGKFQVGKPKAEKKNIDVDLSATVGTLPSLVTATPVLLNTYSAGTGSNQSIGRRVTNLSLHLKMNITPNVSATAAAAPTMARVLVIYDRQPSGVAPTVAQILGTTLYGACSLMNLGYSDRFSVLLDEMHGFGGVATVGTPTNTVVEVPPAWVVNRYVKCKLPSESIASTGFSGAIGQIAEGAIYMLAFSDIAAAGDPPIVTSGASRIRFIDA